MVYRVKSYHETGWRFYLNHKPDARRVMIRFDSVLILVTRFTNVLEWRVITIVIHPWCEMSNITLNVGNRVN